MTSPAPARVFATASERKEQVGQSVQVNDDDLRNLDLSLQVDHPSLRSAADRAGDVQALLPLAFRPEQ